MLATTVFSNSKFIKELLVFLIVRLAPLSSSGTDIEQSEEHYTVSQKVQLLNSIGKDRYSEVFLGKRGSQCVAVKTFSAAIEQSWKREGMIYDAFVLDNENILQFVDSMYCTGKVSITGTSLKLAL